MHPRQVPSPWSDIFTDRPSAAAKAPMSAALKLYEQLTETTDDKTRARLIAEAFDALETRFPQLFDLATQGHVRESELRLQKKK
jgi:hypothetical protein